MVIIISGEFYQAHSFAKTLKAQKIKEGFEYYSFEGGDIQGESKKKTMELLRGKSLFKKNKIIQLRVADYEFVKEFLKDHEETIGDNILVFFAPNNKKLAVNNAHITIHHFELPRRNALRKFIEGEFRARNINPSSDMMAWLMAREHQLADLYPIVNEIEKMSLAEGKWKELMINENIAGPFALTDALAKRDKAAALLLLEEYIQRGEKSLEIASRILWQLRVLILVSTYNLQPTTYKLQFHPFVIQKARQASRLFSLSELKELYIKAISLYESLIFSSLPSSLLLSRFFLRL